MRIRVDRASVVRGGRRVVSGVRFDAAAGEAVLLRGPNGSGKTTLLRAMAGLLSLEAGDVRIGDASIVSDRETAQERIAYAGHRDAVKPQMTARENLLFWARFFGAAEDDAVDRCADALDRFELRAIADAPAAHCSAGQKRRLGLARLTVADRPAWILDEPTVSLDRASAARFAALIDAHTAGGGAAVVATHIDIALARAREVDLSAVQSAQTEQAGAAGSAADPFLDGWERTDA